jgi:hypothetical protein
MSDQYYVGLVDMLHFDVSYRSLVWLVCNTHLNPNPNPNPKGDDGSEAIRLRIASKVAALKKEGQVRITFRVGLELGLECYLGF